MDTAGWFLCFFLGGLFVGMWFTFKAVNFAMTYIETRFVGGSKHADRD